MAVKVKYPGSRYLELFFTLFNTDWTIEFDFILPSGLAPSASYYALSFDRVAGGLPYFGFRVQDIAGANINLTVEGADDAGNIDSGFYQFPIAQIEDLLTHVKLTRVGSTITGEFTPQGQSMQSANMTLTNGNQTVDAAFFGSFVSPAYTSGNPLGTVPADFEFHSVVGDLFIWNLALDPSDDYAVVAGDVKSITNNGSLGGPLVIDTDSVPYLELVEQGTLPFTPGRPKAGGSAGSSVSPKDAAELKRIQKALKSKLNI